MNERMGDAVSVPRTEPCIQQRSSSELLELIHQVEDAVHRGTAQMGDAELFMRCQRELTRREMRYMR